MTEDLLASRWDKGGEWGARRPLEDGSALLWPPSHLPRKVDTGLAAPEPPPRESFGCAGPPHPRPAPPPSPRPGSAPGSARQDETRRPGFVLGDQVQEGGTDWQEGACGAGAPAPPYGLVRPLNPLCAGPRAPAGPAPAPRPAPGPARARAAAGQRPLPPVRSRREPPPWAGPGRASASRPVPAPPRRPRPRRAAPAPWRCSERSSPPPPRPPPPGPSLATPRPRQPRGRSEPAGRARRPGDSGGPGQRWGSQRDRAPRGGWGPEGREGVREGIGRGSRGRADLEGLMGEVRGLAQCEAGAGTGCRGTVQMGD